ncbi:MAG: gamma-glutamyltransferase [Gammaproteobacteria bacterium]|nr:gamma-glutamyltransferase [Gammaproteobacteria bacterium]
MVSSQQRLATIVGLDILKQGGNAVDAAVAVGFTLAVTLPRAGNLGGGGFMLIHLADEKRTVALDYREMAPAAASQDMYLKEDGSVDSDRSRYHGLAIGVPGTVMGLVEALHRFGTMSLHRVLQPAIQLASRGFTVDHDLSLSLRRAGARLKALPETRRVYYHSDGSSYQTGEHFRQPDLAFTLSQIAFRGSKGFYEGDVAQRIVASVNNAGGSMTLDDLRNYEIKYRQPVTGTYRGYRIRSMPPPSSGGIHMIQILNMMEQYDISSAGHNSAESIHIMAEAMRRAYADRSEYLGDPDFVQVPVAQLTDKEYGKRLFKEIDANNTTSSQSVKPGLKLADESPQTTHFSVVDHWGNAVANTYTLNFSYGSGIVAKGTGVLLNNEMDDFSAKPGVANAFGLLGGTANAVEAKKRPLSSMSPTMLFKADSDDLFLVTGTPGGSRIITTTLQIISNVIDHNMNIAEATQAPRFHHQWLPDRLTLEKGFSTDTIQLLKQRGHEIDPSRWAMGSTQSILRVDDGWSGASDTRQSGTLTAGY